MDCGLTLALKHAMPSDCGLSIIPKYFLYPDTVVWPAPRCLHTRFPLTVLSPGSPSG